MANTPLCAPHVAKRRLRVLAGCEYSGRVRQAFRDLGHDAWSCDILAAEDGSPHHIQGDLLAHLGDGWDVLIAFPPCTYLTRAGARWWPGRQQEQADALGFVRKILGSGIPKIGLENPPGRIGTAIRKADQYIHPWQFGHPETKTTGLWLVGLPLLQPTHVVYDAMQKLPAKLKNRTHYMAPGPDRWRERSRTYQGIATAMAAQWGGAVGVAHA